MKDNEKLEQALNLIYSALKHGTTETWREDATNYIHRVDQYGICEPLNKGNTTDACPVKHRVYANNSDLERCPVCNTVLPR